jgi:ferritin-like metal-binding protein YciE
MAAAKEKGVEDLFLETLKDIYHAEKQILRNLPKMAKASKTPELRQALERHREETEGQVERLEQIFESLGKPARGKPCQAIAGIVEESQEVMDEFKNTVALEPGLIAAAQAVEHYEISRYGTLIAWADQLGKKDVSRLLGETLAEEKKTDELLTRLAEQSVNQKAA